MIEIPEAQTLAQQLDKEIKGKTIAKVVAGKSPHGFAFYNGDPKRYPKLLEGKKISEVTATAGYVEIFAQDVTLLFHDGTNIRYLLPEAKRPEKHQLLIEFEDKSAIVVTIQMYGGMMAFVDGAFENKYYQGAKSKPSPLSEKFTQEYFEKIVDATPDKLSIKALLATEQRIPGLGNGVLQDILFKARLHPQTKVKNLTAKDFARLYKSIKTTIKEMTERGGRDTEKNLYGEPGGYQTILSSKTWNQPCPQCGGVIKRKAFLGGNVYFCERCQPLAN